MSEFAEGGPQLADYQPRTIKMCVRAIKDMNGNQPIKKIIYKESTTLDLSLPSPVWRDQSFDSFEGRETKIRFVVSVSREHDDFFPLEFKEYLRFDVAVRGQILGGTAEQALTASTWIHPSSAYAASKIILGPLAEGPIHFVFSTVFQVAQNGWRIPIQTQRNVA